DALPQLAPAALEVVPRRAPVRRVAGRRAGEPAEAGARLQLQDRLVRGPPDPRRAASPRRAAPPGRLALAAPPVPRPLPALEREVPLRVPRRAQLAFREPRQHTRLPRHHPRAAPRRGSLL